MLARLRIVANDVQPVHVGQAQVEQDQVRTHPRERVERFLRGARRLDPKVVAAEVGLHRAQDRRLVVDDQDARPRRVRHACAASGAGCRSGTASLSGSVKVNRAPAPARFSAQTRPPCASTRPLTIASPSPRPCGRGLPSITR